jgi:hypothetical protein
VKQDDEGDEHEREHQHREGADLESGRIVRVETAFVGGSGVLMWGSGAGSVYGRSQRASRGASKRHKPWSAKHAFKERQKGRQIAR